MILKWLLKNKSDIFLWGFILIILFSPNAKSWVLRQIMRTGFFNAQIENTDSLKPDSNNKISEFYFSNEQGEVKSIEELRGNVIFINFWASWCPPCRAEFPSILSFYNQYKNKDNIYFLFINEDKDVHSAQKYLTKEKYHIPIFRLQSSISDKIYSGVLPTTLIVDKSGHIRLRHEGFSNYDSKRFFTQIDNLLQEPF